MIVLQICRFFDITSLKIGRGFWKRFWISFTYYEGEEETDLCIFWLVIYGLYSYTRFLSICVNIDLWQQKFFFKFQTGKYDKRYLEPFNP